MAAPKGNKYYLQCSYTGRDKNFESPEELWNAFVEYQEWNKNNPWYKKDFIKSGDFAGQIVDLPIERPMSLMAFANYCGMTYRALENYGKEDSYKDYFPIYARIHAIIYNQKFEGAAIGCYNPVIISRDLGLTDKSEVKHSGEISIADKIREARERSKRN